MSRFLPVVAAVLVTGAAGAQPPAPVHTFRPSGTTGNLLTSESRAYWTKVGPTLRAAVSAEKLTHALPLPASTGIVAKLAPARKDQAADTESEKTVWLGADRRRMSFDPNR